MNEQLIGDLFAESQRQMTGSSSRQFSEKFAELIVRECAEIANKAEPYKANDLIKQHFGVEDV